MYYACGQEFASSNQYLIEFTSMIALVWKESTLQEKDPGWSKTRLHAATFITGN